MGKVFAEIDDKLASWIRGQQMFFVATAPEIGGHINLSPKGPIESLQVLDPHTIAYLDLIGSGAETVAHLRQNGRICVMLCAFQGPPRILRMHGRGTVLAAGCDRYDRMAAAFDVAAMPAAEHAARSIIVVEVRADRRFVRLRRTADGRAGASPATRRLGRQQAGQGRPGGARRVRRGAQRREHRRAARAVTAADRG